LKELVSLNLKTRHIYVYRYVTDIPLRFRFDHTRLALLPINQGTR